MAVLWNGVSTGAGVSAENHNASIPLGSSLGDAFLAYSGDRTIDRDPYAVPLHAGSVAGLPPALVVLGGCDRLRDEGRAYAPRLRDEGGAVDEVCYPGQPHGFINFGFPATGPAFEHIGRWPRANLHGTGPADHR